MKTTLPAALLFTLLAASAQGPLTPPPGASPAIGPANALNPSGQPQATMKSLHQVEPRTPLTAGSPGVAVNANGGFTITASGSYYLTGNLTVATGDGILISASRVSLDLMGFTIESTNPAAATGSGVLIYSTWTAVTVSNGQVRGNSIFNATDGTLTNTGFSDGISALGPNTGIAVSDLVISGIKGLGTTIGSGSVDRCTITGCQFGIFAKTVRDCSVESCRIGVTTSSSGFVSRCRISVSGAACTGISGDDNLVENCHVTAAGGSATGIGSASGNIHHCWVSVSVTAGAGIGIQAQNGLVSGCHVLSSAFSGGTGADGIDATGGIVNTCRIKANYSALKASVADGCFITSGAGIPGSTTITNRYNMPASP